MFAILMIGAGPCWGQLDRAGAPDRTAEGFAIPRKGKVFDFPRDHGSHPDFRLEWWYVTGHLQGKLDSRRYGFQATFFRVGLESGEGQGSEHSAFGQRHLYMAHMALSDFHGSEFLHEQRLNREGWDAHAKPEKLDLRNGNWTMRMPGPDDRMELSASILGRARLDFQLTPRKPLVVFGEEGVSRKGASPSASSYYLTWPRLEVDGALTLDGETIQVSGQAWMDHEISSSQLSPGQVGWDWASLQFDDGTEWMVYRLRDEAGEADEFSTLAMIDHEGQVRHIRSEGFTWVPLRHWKSTETGIEYPIEVRIDVDSRHADATRTSVRLEPLMDHQEMVGHAGSIQYWEGACRILDESGKPIGSAYMELTGYAESLQEQLR